VDLTVDSLTYIVLLKNLSLGGDDEGANNIPQTYTASGTYTYNPDTGVLVFNLTSSNFTGCGPDEGQETINVDSLTATTMHWIEDDMTWTRDSGKAGDITGTWDWVDENGNAYEANVDGDGAIVVIGEVVDCDGNGNVNISTFSVQSQPLC